MVSKRRAAGSCSVGRRRRRRSFLAVSRLAAAIAAAVGMVAGLMAAKASVAHASDPVIGFDDLTIGTVVDHQYHAQGVDFGPPGLLPVIRQVGLGEAQSNTQVADISTCNCSIPRVGDVTGTFAAAQRRVTAFVGEFGSGSTDAQMTLTAYDGARAVVAKSTPAVVSPGAGFHTQLVATSTSADITSFEIAARPGIDNGKPLGIDDLSFSTRVAAPPLAAGGSSAITPGVSPVAPKSSVALAAADNTSSPQGERRPHLSVPRQSKLGLTLATLASRQDGRLVVPFQLSGSASVRVTVRQRGRRRPLVTETVRGKQGANRVVLPARLSASLAHRGATITVSVRARSGTASGVVSIPSPPGSAESNAPAPNEFGIPQQELGHLPSPVVALAAYPATSDGRQHVIVATKDGNVTELIFGAAPGVRYAEGPDIEQNLLGHFGAPIAGVAGYDAPNDGFQHVFIAFESGTVLEDYWRPTDHKLHQDTPIFSAGGISGISAFTAPVTGWNKWPQWVVIGGRKRRFVTLLTSPDADVYTIPPPTPDVPPSQQVSTLGMDGIRTAFYSAFGGPVAIGCRNNACFPGASLFAPFSWFTDDGHGGTKIGLKYGGGLDELSGPVAGYMQTGNQPDLDHLVHVEGSSDDAFVVELHPNLQGSPDCQQPSNLAFYPNPDPSANRFEPLSVGPWCTNHRAHFHVRINALAGYYAPQDNRQHIITATDDNKITELSFAPVAGQTCVGHC